MRQQPTQRRRTAVKSGDPVGRCCQRHGITGRVITDWYPTAIIKELLHNRCCQVVVHSSIRDPVRRQTRRRTGSRASDNIPVQSAQPCAGSCDLAHNNKCNLRFTLEPEYISRCLGRQALGPKQLAQVSDARLCEVPQPAAEVTLTQKRRQTPRTHSVGQQTTGGQLQEAQLKPLICWYQKPPGVLIPRWCVARTRRQGFQSREQHPHKCRQSVINRSCGGRSQQRGHMAAMLVAGHTADQVSPKTSQNDRFRCVGNGRNGGQPGGSGVQRTIGSRHPRRQVPASGKSMSLGGSIGRWSGDQNPTDWYPLGIKNVCDSGIQYPGLTTTAGPLSHRLEVTR